MDIDDLTETFRGLLEDADRVKSLPVERAIAEARGVGVPLTERPCPIKAGRSYNGRPSRRREGSGVAELQEMVIYGVSFDMVGKQPIVLLKTIDGNKFLPIWIGHPEAAAILMKLQGATTPRPMTHDLISEMISELDAQCTRVSVTELKDNTFYASITLRVNGQEIEIDSRPSDALAVAVRTSAPIFAAEDVIQESAIEFEQEAEDTEEVVDKFKAVPGRGDARGLRRRARASAAARPAARLFAPAPAPSILWTSCSNLMPAASAACGSRLVSVRPGDRLRLEHLQARRRRRGSCRRARSRSTRAAGTPTTASSCACAATVCRELGGTHEVGLADLVARLEVVEVLLLAASPRRSGARCTPPSSSSSETASSRPSTWRSSRTRSS